MATGEEDPDQAEQPGTTTEAADPSAGGPGWFSVDPSSDPFEGSDDARRASGSTGSGQSGHDVPVDRHTEPPGPDLIHAGMVHVDPEPGIDPPAGIDGPKDPATDGRDTQEGSRRDPATTGPEMAGTREARPGDPPGETMRRGPERAGDDPADGGSRQGWLAARRPFAELPGSEQSSSQPWPPSPEAGPGRSRDPDAPGPLGGTGSPVGPVDASPGTAMSEPPHRSGEPALDPDGSLHERERGRDSGTGLGVAAGTGDGPGVDAAPEVGREAGTVRESDRDAAPVPWTEPALPMPWPPPREAPAGEGNGGLPAEDEPDLPPAPDPRWPRLFSVAVGTGADHLDRGGDPQPHQRVAGHDAPPPGPAPPGGDQATTSPPPWHRQRPDGSGEDATTTIAVDAGPAEPAGGKHDVVQGGIDSTSGHGAGVASEAAAGQAGEVPAPPTGPAETEQIASRPPTSASGASSGAHANMAAAGQSNPSVAGATEGGGGVVNQRPENRSIEEDEAAIAVREAVSRAAAQAGVDVSRETLPDALVGPTPSTPPGAVVEAPGDTPRIDSETAARNARVTFRIHTDGTNGHGRILAVANQKGGVGKSTTAVNLGAYLALAGARVLVVDLDPQGNASTGLGLDHREIEPSIYDVLTGETPPATAIRATTVANLYVLPSTIDLAGAEVELVSAMSREGRLGRALETIYQYYDTVLIDCPPSLGLLTVNALAAADELLIPIQCEYYALEGLGQLLRNVELVRANLNPELRIGGIVLTMYDGRTRLAEQVVQEVRKHFSDLVYQTVVPRSVRLSEAPGYGLPIALYDPLSRGGIAYRDLAFELAERSGLLAPTGEGAI